MYNNRVIFLDNLRSLAVLSVVLLHAANAYTNLLIWWPVSDKDTSILVDWINAFFDAFILPLLFFISGYFAIPTIQKYGTVSFLKNKLKRLGIPWLVCIITICPILPLVYHYTRNNLTLSMSYLDLWILLMKKTAEFNVGVINSMDLLMKNNQFFQRYMWFLSLLLLFFFIFSFIYTYKKNWFKAALDSVPSEKRSSSSRLYFLIIFGSLTFLSSVILVIIMFLLFPKTSNPEAWLTLGNIIQFQPSRISAYVIYFIMGIIVYKNNWIGRGRFSNHLIVWIISFIILLLSYLYLLDLFLGAAGLWEKIYGASVFFIRNLLTVSIIGLLSTLGSTYWNRITVFNKNLAANSYNIYLAHYIFVIIFQLLLFSIPWISGFFKFIIVSILSILSAYCTSHFLIKPYPRVTIAVMFIILLIMFIVIHP